MCTVIYVCTVATFNTSSFTEIEILNACLPVALLILCVIHVNAFERLFKVIT